MKKKLFISIIIFMMLTLRMNVYAQDIFEMGYRYVQDGAYYEITSVEEISLVKMVNSEGIAVTKEVHFSGVLYEE